MGRGDGKNIQNVPKSKCWICCALTTIYTVFTFTLYLYSIYIVFITADSIRTAFDIISNLEGEGNGTPLQHSCLESPMDGRAWWAAVHGVAKSRTRLSDFPFTFHFHALEKKMATHSSVPAWRIPGTGEPGGLPSLGSHRVGHDWIDLAAAAAAGLAGKKEARQCKALPLLCYQRFWTIPLKL